MRIGEVPAVRENCLLPGRRQLDNPASLEVKMNRRCFLASGVAAGAIAWHEVGAESIQKTQAWRSLPDCYGMHNERLCRIDNS